MEEILRKNIFRDEDLKKLSPDYCSSDIILRMQMRRTQVRDTHSHARKTLNENVQRKAIKRTRENINKEMVKFRNEYEKINLKNQIMLKNAIKLVESTDLTKIDVINNCNDADDDEIIERINDVAEDEVDLLICNDANFKMNEKQTVTKIKTVSTLQKVTKVAAKSDLEKFSNDFEQVLRIDCKLIQPPVPDDNEVKDLDSLESPVAKRNYLSNLNNDQNINDLQALLIMMAMAPKPQDEQHDVLGELDDPKDIIREVDDNTSTEKFMLKNVEHNIVKENDDITQILNVAAIRVEINDKQKLLIKKYVEKWRHFVSNKKLIMEKQRRATLDSFFNKLENKKMEMNQSPPVTSKFKLLARDYKKYQHRYHVQKHIIALQKAKLEEQNRQIEQLKCNRIIEASKYSVDILKEEVRKTYYEMDKQLKPKLKCLTQELKMHDIEEPSLVLHCLKVPQFLQRMEKRARDREEKHAMIRERRNQLEEERMRQKQQAELAKAVMDKEEKLKRMKELRQKRRRERMDGIRKKQHAERMRALRVMADLHYEKTLMAKYGILPFKLLIKLKQDNIEKGKEHYKFQLKKNVFFTWMWHTEDMLFERNFIAADFYRKKILKKGFDSFKKIHHEYVLKKQVADDYYDLYVTHQVFRRFRDGIEVIRHENEAKWQKAVVYNNSNILFKTFTCWRTLPALNALKREQEARKARWREKVLQVVPDYSPPDD